MIAADRLFGFTVRSFDFGGVGEGDLAAVGSLDDVVGEDPVFCVGDGAGGLGFDVEVVEFEIDERGVGVGGDGEGFLCSGGLDVPDVDVGEVREALVFGDWRGEGYPIRRDGFGVGAFGEFGVAVGGVPVHVDGDGDGDAGEGEVVDADVFGVAATDVRGLEEHSAADRGFGGEVPGFDVVEAAGGLGTDSDGGGSAADDGVVNLDVVGGLVDAEAVGVTSSLEAEGVIVVVDVGVGDFDVVGGVDVDAVGGGAVAVFVVADGEAVDGDVVGVEDLDGPEAGAPEGETTAVVNVGGVLDEGETTRLAS